MPTTREDAAVYVDADGLIVYRASSLGRCRLGLVASRSGESAAPPSSGLRAAMDASSDMESLVLDLYGRERGHSVIWQQKTVELPIRDSIIVRGHLDGLDQEDDAILEVKSLGPGNWDKFNKGGLEALGGLGEAYKWQGAIYGHATDRPVRFVIAEKLKNEDGTPYVGDLVIEPAVDAEKLVPLLDIHARVLEVEAFAEIDELPDCDRDCTQYDSWAHVHTFPEPARGTDDLLQALRLDEQLASQIAELTTQREELRDSIKAMHTPGKYTAGPYSVSIYTVNPTRFDRKSFKKAHPDLDEAFTVPGQPYVALKVTGSSYAQDEERAG